MERRYLSWLSDESAGNPDGLGAEGTWLCPRHLWDFAIEASGATIWALDLHGGRLEAEIEQWRSLIRSPSGAWLMWWLRDRRELDLVLAGLTDMPTRSAYYHSHGLCWRHVQARPDPAVREVLAARLRILVWELDERGRKTTWPFRHEAHGDEATAWVRAPVQIDARAFLGAPPPLQQPVGERGD
jgi:hypothetical protein